MKRLKNRRHLPYECARTSRRNFAYSSWFPRHLPYEYTRTSRSDFAHSSCFPRLVEVFRLRQHRSQGTFHPMGGSARDHRPCPCAVTFDDEPLVSSARKPFPEGITHGAWGLFSTFGARYVCLVRN